MKKVLFITYMFPPIAGSGIQRSLKFIKFLPENGITPIVFCPQNARWKALDKKNLELPYLKQTKIYRHGIHKLKYYYDLRFESGVTKHPYFYFLGLKYIWFIDFFSSWYFECRRKALEIADKEKVDCIYTTSPPHSVHFFGKYLKSKLGIPWVMDLRDAMYDEPNKDFSKISDRMQANIERFYENKFYRDADAIISVSQPILDSLALRHPSLKCDTKTHLIPNGFDDEDYTNASIGSKEEGKLLITYTGAFLMKRTPAFFLEALASLVSMKRINGDDLIIRFVGYFDEAVLSVFKKYSSVLSIQVIDFQPYEKTLAFQQSSDLLLLIVSVDEEQGGGQIFTGKFYEYVGAQKPIFALAPDGPLKDTIEKGHLGAVAPPKNISKIADIFENCYQEWKHSGTLPYQPNSDLLDSCNRKKLTEKLAAIVDKVT